MTTMEQTRQLAALSLAMHKLAANNPQATLEEAEPLIKATIIHLISHFDEEASIEQQASQAVAEFDHESDSPPWL